MKTHNCSKLTALTTMLLAAAAQPELLQGALPAPSTTACLQVGWALQQRQWPSGLESTIAAHLVLLVPGPTADAGAVESLQVGGSPPAGRPASQPAS